MKRVPIKKFKVYVDSANYSVRVYLFNSANRIVGILNFVETINAANINFVDADGNFNTFMIFQKYDWCIHLLETYKTYFNYDPSNPGFITSLESGTA